MPILSSIRRSDVTSWLRLARRALNLNGTLRRLQRAGEFDQESVTDGLDLGAVEPGKDFAKQPAVFFEQFESEPIVALRQGAVSPPCQ